MFTVYESDWMRTSLKTLTHCYVNKEIDAILSNCDKIMHIMFDVIITNARDDYKMH